MAYTRFARDYYGDEPRGRYRNLLPLIRQVRLLFADLPRDPFGPMTMESATILFGTADAVALSVADAVESGGSRLSFLDLL